MRGRELKLCDAVLLADWEWMPPMRGRELKLLFSVCFPHTCVDAPYAGARIETKISPPARFIA